MSENKPNKYWLGKIRLWFILHGGLKVSECYFCELCHYSFKGYGGVGCIRRMDSKGRLMFKRDFSDIQFKEHWGEPPGLLITDNGDWVCAEWVKDV